MKKAMKMVRTLRRMIVRSMRKRRGARLRREVRVPRHRGRSRRAEVQQARELGGVDGVSLDIDMCFLLTFVGSVCNKYVANDTLGEIGVLVGLCLYDYFSPSLFYHPLFFCRTVRYAYSVDQAIGLYLSISNDDSWRIGNPR